MVYFEMSEDLVKHVVGKTVHVNICVLQSNNAAYPFLPVLTDTNEPSTVGLLRHF